MKSIQQSLRSLKNPSERKLRLFAVACCKEIESLLQDERSRVALEVAEAYADSLTTLYDLQIASLDANNAEQSADGDYATNAAAWAVVDISNGTWTAREMAFYAADEAALALHYSGAALQRQHLLLEDIFAPHRPLVVSQKVQLIAQNLYVTKDFAALPVLADYLEEHECQDQEVLAHCRSNLPHVRGCWVLDAILGKQ